jgi:hypothetical protein
MSMGIHAYDGCGYTDMGIEHMVAWGWVDQDIESYATG